MAGRSSDVAAALGGEAMCFEHPRLNRGWRKAVRYGVSAAETALYLARRRPKKVIVTNPPIFPGLIACGYSRLVGATFLLDSHPGGFGAQGDRFSARVQPLHRWVARRAASVLVASEDWVEVVQGWGGAADIVHDPRPPWTVAPPSMIHTPPRVLCVGILAPDEPVAEVIRAAQLLPDVHFDITGDARKRPVGLEAALPLNVTFTGFLRGEQYRQAIEQADIVISLTTEPTSIMRAACEGVYAQRPIVITDSPALRRVFPHAQFVSNEAAGIAAGIRRVLEDFEYACSTLSRARDEQQGRSDRQLRRLRARLDGALDGVGHESEARRSAETAYKAANARNEL